MGANVIKQDINEFSLGSIVKLTAIATPHH
jgi:hypothetical protein